MACRCIKCGWPCACGEEYCEKHLMEMSCKDDVDRNIYAGGRFYGEKLERDNPVGHVDL